MKKINMTDRKGCIVHPQLCKMKRIGEKSIMNCGMEAVIIAYRNANDMDVRFADGTVVEHKPYVSFKKGCIANHQIHKIKRSGEKYIMICGMEAEIVTYREYKDIDVRFADGTVVEHKSYFNFRKRMIANPNYTFADQKIGEKQMMNCGMEAEIITYRGYNDLDVRFADGTVVEHKSYTSFKKNSIANPKIHKIKRTGEKCIMGCGMEAEIVTYRRSDDLDICFADGTIVKHRRYDEFKKGNIPNPNINVNALKRIDKKRIMNCGMEAKIIAYRGTNDIDVQFADGTIVKHKTYHNFMEGKIANINICKKRTHEASLKRTGEKRIMNCGMEAEIICYRSSTDIDVRFADQTIIKNKSYGSFVRGCISNPNLKNCKSV